MQEQDPNPVIEEIEKEIAETKRKASEDNFEIEITEEKKEEPTEAKKEEPTQEEIQEQKEKYSANVKRKIDRLTKQRYEAEQQTKANLPIETLIKVWKEGQGKGAKTSENMEAVKKTKSIPKPAGVLQGGEQPRPSEEDEVWSRVMSASKSGSIV